MAKKVVRLDEHQFNELVKESVSEVLNEIGYRTASLPHGANYNAMQSKTNIGDNNAKSKMDISNSIRLEVLSKSIHDTFPNLKLMFIERDKANQFYSVILSFDSMNYIDDERFVMKGNISISGGQPKIGYIEFNFKTQTFYRVNFYGAGTIRRLFTLMIDEDCKSTLQSFLAFITNFQYSEKDYEHNVDTQGSTPSKRHIS